MRTKKVNLNNPKGFLTIESALTSAIELIKMHERPEKSKNTAVWLQRYKQGTLSNKKITEILEMAGFKKAVEEQWIFIKKPTNEKFSPTPTPALRGPVPVETFVD